MNGTVWKHVVERWAFVARSPKFLAIFLAFVVTGTVFGPFGISEASSLLGRLQLSLVLNTISWTIGILIVVPIRMWMFSKGHSHPKSIIFSATIANFIILPTFIWTLEAWLDRTVDLSQIFEQFLALAALITVIPLFMAPPPDSRLVSGKTPEPSNSDAEVITEASGTNSVLLNISPDKRGDLWALVARDHYVEVITERGSELILMRLSDAIKQCDNRAGIRCHRSAWVSKIGFKNVFRKPNRKLVVRLPDGNEISVSRSREKQVLSYFDAAKAA
ncbi:MAG: LytTR family DNA-binding domain-containing protein [Rhizobiaceae bacterium]